MAKMTKDDCMLARAWVLKFMADAPSDLLPRLENITKRLEQLSRQAYDVRQFWPKAKP